METVLFMEWSCQETCTHMLLPPPKVYEDMPNLFHYRKFLEFYNNGGVRLNYTGRYIHTHRLGCYKSYFNSSPDDWSLSAIAPSYFTKPHPAADPNDDL